MRCERHGIYECPICAEVERSLPSAADLDAIEAEKEIAAATRSTEEVTGCGF